MQLHNLLLYIYIYTYLYIHIYRYTDIQVCIYIYRERDTPLLGERLVAGFEKVDVVNDVFTIFHLPLYTNIFV